MRTYELTGAARDVLRTLGPDARRAVAAVIAELMDDHVPLVGPNDFSVTRGSQIMGRAVPGADLVVCYVPAGNHLFVVDITRRPAR